MMRREQTLVYLFAATLLVIAIQFFSKPVNAMSCIPTCSSVDTRFIAFGGQDIATFVYESMTYGITSPANSNILEIGVFDGENTSKWDLGPGEMGATLEFTLFADPLGDLSGTMEVGKWLGDGSDGINTGIPMPDNEWFDIFVENVPEALAESGNYSYFMRVRNLDTTQQALNNFKIRTNGSIFIFPTDQPFAYQAGLWGQTGALEVIDIVYPNIDINDPECVNLGQYCDFTDPDCCLFGSTYDGTFSFFFELENPQEVLNFWDGDFDFGTKLPNEGGPFEDTDDPNTTDEIPDFADVPNTNPESSTGARPRDDNPLIAFTRPPNIVYEIISPNGTVYLNSNPSGTNEWELFQLNTEPGCAPNICDIEVDDIPAGIWEMRISGLDLSNLNFIRGFEKFVGVDEQGEPVPPLPPDPPNPIPAISEIGLFILSVILVFAGAYAIRIRKRHSH